MKEVKIRLLYPSTVKHEEVEAALKAFGKFSGFGVLHDHAAVEGQDALRGVRNGKSVRSIVTSPSPTVQHYDFMPGISEIFFTKDIIPMALTPNRMVELVDNGLDYLKGEPRIGVARQGEGAVVSLFRIRQLSPEGVMMDGAPYRLEAETGLRAKAIEVAVGHELGHVLGRKSHCPTSGCIMQENENFIDFVERFVKQRVDFCRECCSVIGSNVNRMQYDF